MQQAGKWTNLRWPYGYNTAVTLNPSIQEAFDYLGILYDRMRLYNEI